MQLRDVLVPEFDHEMALTRRVLDRVPFESSGWRPHPKSMTLGQLASHVADIPSWASTLVQGDGYDMGTDPPEPPATHASAAVLLEAFDTNTRGARAILSNVSDAELLAPWTLRQREQPVFTSPRFSVLRGFLFNHVIHHRGQLSVYLRELGVAIPSIYGPSADER
ncbi:MAG: DinB family protein [Vicinamibacterales bacterium]